MKDTLLEMLTSKKFIAAIAAGAIYGIGHLGLGIDPDLLTRVYVALLVYVGGQGLADMGKSAALIHVGAAKDAPAAPAPSSSSAAAPMLAVLLLGAVVLQPACAGKHPGQLAKQAAIDCAKQEAPALLAAAVALAVTAIGPPKVDWAQEELIAEQHGIEVGGCALAELVHALWPGATSSSPGVAVAALASPDPGQAAAYAALERLRVKAGGARFATAAGEL